MHWYELLTGLYVIYTDVDRGLAAVVKCQPVVMYTHTHSNWQSVCNCVLPCYERHIEHLYSPKAEIQIIQYRKPYLTDIALHQCIPAIPVHLSLCVWSMSL